MRRMPLHIEDDRLLGGLDLTATLANRAAGGTARAAGRGRWRLRVAGDGRAHRASTAARLAAVLDQREVVAERHGIAARSISRLGVVALDEGLADDEQLPARLRERLALSLILVPQPRGAETEGAWFTRGDVLAARRAAAERRNRRRGDRQPVCRSARTRHRFAACPAVRLPGRARRCRARWPGRRRCQRCGAGCRPGAGAARHRMPAAQPPTTWNRWRRAAGDEAPAAATGDPPPPPPAAMANPRIRQPMRLR